MYTEAAGLDDIRPLGYDAGVCLGWKIHYYCIIDLYMI